MREWSPTLYNIAAVMNAVLEHILRHDPDDTTLLEALAILYSHEKKYDRALAMYLKYVNITINVPSRCQLTALV